MTSRDTKAVGGTQTRAVVSVSRSGSISAKDCRNLSAALIRDSLPLLRSHASAGKEIRALVESVKSAAQDDVVEASWRAAIDAIRALYHTSPKGTQRERQTLLSIARDKELVRAMIAAQRAQKRKLPCWPA